MGGWAIFLFFHTLNAVFWEPLKSHSISIGACSFRKLRVEQWSASSNKGSNVDRNNDKMSNNLMPIQKLPLVSRTKWDLTRHCLKMLQIWNTPDWNWWALLESLIDAVSTRKSHRRLLNVGFTCQIWSGCRRTLPLTWWKHLFIDTAFSAVRRRK